MSHRSRILCTLLKEFLIIDISSLLYRQVEELQAQVGQLSARCQEQQQDLDLLKVFFHIVSMNICYRMRLSDATLLFVNDDDDADI